MREKGRRTDKERQKGTGTMTEKEEKTYRKQDCQRKGSG